MTLDPRAFPVRFHRLRKMGMSPAHYLAALRAQDKSTEAQKRGSLVHALALGQPTVTWPGKVRRGKQWDAFQAEHAGKLIASVREHNEASPIIAALRSNPHATELLSGTPEVETDWNIQGRRCEGRIDVIAQGRIAELKTTRCAHPDAFMRQARYLNYHAQLAWYADGVGVNVAHIVAVESVEPYAVSVFRLSDRTLDEGRRIYRAWFEKLMVCEATNEWPGYVQSVVDFDVMGDDVDYSLLDEEAAQ
jgi:hypothetical protein